MKKTYLSGLTALAIFAVLSLAGAASAETSDWKSLSIQNKEWNSISCPSSRTCYVAAGLYLVGGTGAVAKTTDGGDTFTVQSIPSSNPLHSISCPTRMTCYAGGDFGTVLKTTDGGANWKEILVGSVANRPAIMGVYAPNENTVMLVGKNAFLNRTTDGGGSFAPPTVRTFADYYDVFFADSNRGFATGNDGAYLATTDGGDLWTTNGGLFGAGTMYVVRSVGPTTLYAAGDTLQKSTDSGKTWKKLSTASAETASETFRHLDFLSETTGYVVTDRNVIRKTTDGGATWSADLVSNGAGILRVVKCPTSEYCIAIGGFGTALRKGTPPAPEPEPVAPAPAPVAATTTVAATPTVTATTTLTATVASSAASSQATSERSKAEVEAELAKLLATVAGLMAQTSGTNTAAVATAAPSPVAATSASEVKITSVLKKGATGSEVRALQELLAGVGGVYPQGTVNGTFGPATRKAVETFQTKYNLASPGEPGYGQVGPKTRAKLYDVAGKGTASEPSAGVRTQVLKRTLKKGATGDEVRQIQQVLAKDPEVYPEGLVNGTFGPATDKAIKRFQEKHGISGAGEPGYGQTGPKTRAKLEELAE